MRPQPASKTDSDIRSTDFSASAEQGSLASSEIPDEEEGNGWGDEEEDWGSLEASMNAASVNDDKPSWSPAESHARAAPPKPAPIKQGWDDGDDDAGWGAISDPAPKVDKDEEKRLREEKRAARKAELAAKREARKAGPLKLGAKKKEDEFDFQDF